MQRIDKSNNLSTKYKEWVDAFEEKGENHDEYNSSNNKFYKDVKFDLLRCQNGLCAFTEMRLCNTDFLTDDYWKDGRYQYVKGKTEADGQIEHFDSTLKKTQGWLWNNLFVSDSGTNNRKRTNSIDNILKPDLDDYDPLERMEFDIDDNVYIAHTQNYSEDEQKRINEMIKTLGINYPGAVWTRRKRFLNKVKKEIELGVFELSEYIDTEFPTVVRVLDQLFNQKINQ